MSAHDCHILRTSLINDSEEQEAHYKQTGDPCQSGALRCRCVLAEDMLTFIKAHVLPRPPTIDIIGQWVVLGRKSADTKRSKELCYLDHGEEWESQEVRIKTAN